MEFKFSRFFLLLNQAISSIKIIWNNLNCFGRFRFLTQYATFQIDFSGDNWPLTECWSFSI